MLKTGNTYSSFIHALPPVCWIFHNKTKLTFRVLDRDEMANLGQAPCAMDLSQNGYGVWWLWWLWWLWSERVHENPCVYPDGLTSATDDGDHVPVDMTPHGPAPVCRAQKNYPRTVAVSTARIDLGADEFTYGNQHKSTKPRRAPQSVPS